MFKSAFYVLLLLTWNNVADKALSLRLPTSDFICSISTHSKSCFFSVCLCFWFYAPFGTFLCVRTNYFFFCNRFCASHFSRFAFAPLTIVGTETNFVVTLQHVIKIRIYAFINRARFSLQFYSKVFFRVLCTQQKKNNTDKKKPPRIFRM